MPLKNIIAGRCTAALLVVLFSTGCTTQFVKMDEVPSGALQSGSKVALVYALPCSNMDTLMAKCSSPSTPLNEGVYVDYGSSIVARSVGLHDEVEAKLKTLKPANTILEELEGKLAPLLTNLGHEVQVRPDPLLVWNLEKRGKASSFFYSEYNRGEKKYQSVRPNGLGEGISGNFDFQPLINELDTDFLMVIELLRYGVDRRYTALVSVAMEPPMGTAAIRVSLFQRGVDKPLYNNIINRREPVDGEWKTPPDFEDLMSIPPKVLRAAIDDAAQEILAR